MLSLPRRRQPSRLPHDAPVREVIPEIKATFLCDSPFLCHARHQLPALTRCNSQRPTSNFPCPAIESSLTRVIVDAPPPRPSSASTPPQVKDGKSKMPARGVKSIRPTPSAVLALPQSASPHLLLKWNIELVARHVEWFQPRLPPEHRPLRRSRLTCSPIVIPAAAAMPLASSPPSVRAEYELPPPSRPTGLAPHRLGTHSPLFYVKFIFPSVFPAPSPPPSGSSIGECLDDLIGFQSWFNPSG